MATLAIDADALADLGWDTVVDALVRRCATERGEARAGALSFAQAPEEARARIEEIDEARRLRAAEAGLPLGGITDVEMAARRAYKGAVLAGEELVAVAEAARGISALGRHLRRHEDRAPRLAGRAEELGDLGHVAGPILDAFEPGPRLADHASDALGGLRRKVRALTAELESRAQGLLGDPGLAPHLQDRFTTQREDRYVVPIKASAQAWVKGIVHGTSQSGQTVFLEPESIVDLNNRLVIAECEVADEERRILAELSAYVAEEADAICAGLEIAAELDRIHAGARLADDLDASPPRVEPGAELSLRRARNPQLVLMGRPCVPNDILVRPRELLLISGPNAGGKTVALKTAGSAVAMAHAGLHVPADAGSAVPWLSAVYTHLGDAQSLDRDLSTFSAQVVDFHRLLREADESALVLFDEIAVGTDPEQGAALAEAVIEALADRGAAGIVTTHYERLKAMPARDSRFVNASVGFDVEAMQPTFELKIGLPGASGAFAVARRLGLPEPLVARAETLAGEASAGVEELLAEIERQRDAAAQAREAIERQKRAAEEERARARSEVEALRAEKRRMEEAEASAAVASLRRAREEIDRVRAEVRKAERGHDVKAAERRLDRAARRVTAKPGEARARGGGVHPDAIEAGAEVYVAGLGGRGRVVEKPAKGRVTVQMGALRTQVSVEEIRLESGGREGAAPEGAAPEAAERGRRRGGRGSEGRESGAGAPAPDEQEPDRRRGAEPAPLRTPETTLDVRGKRVHEALAEVDRFLDQALLTSRDAVFILHGHGTGALRRAVREHLGAHPSIAEHGPAEPGEGGDGVTLARLRPD